MKIIHAGMIPPTNISLYFTVYKQLQQYMIALVFSGNPFRALFIYLFHQFISAWPQYDRAPKKNHAGTTVGAAMISYS